jgi:predicted HicB family RNase H-like nuclease
MTGMHRKPQENQSQTMNVMRYRGYDPETHARAALAAQLAGMSLNQWGEQALRQAAERQKA